MKKTILVFFSIVFLCTFAFSNGAKEIQNLNIAVMQGPTGFSSVMLPGYANISVYPSPNEAVAKLVNGELDMAVLPANAVANLYNKGIKIKAIATVGEGMLSVIGTNAESEEIAVPGAGGTPEHMAMLLYPQYERNLSVTAPAQLAQLLIAGKCELAILPQPFVSMILSKNSNVKILSDVQKEWSEKTGLSQFPMSVLVVREDFEKNNKDIVKQLKKDYKASVEKVLASVHEAALKIEEKGIMASAMAEPAIPQCALVYKDGSKAQEELENYFKQLLTLAPDAIGGKIPDTGLYNY